METGGGGESGGYKGRKDAIKEYSRRQTGAQKIPLPGHHDHAEGTVEIMIIQAASAIASCLAACGCPVSFRLSSILC